MDKIDESYRLSPCSQRQQQLIEKILKDFPDSKEMLEYEDYLKEPTVGNASEFITRALEDNAYEVMQTKTYADYIATRPRAERFGSHGLFTDDGVHVKLGEVSEELNHYEGNVWTVIISLRREDAERLGFNQGERWREMLRTQTDALAANFKIPKEDLKWYAAFHNESHHPHVHLIPKGWKSLPIFVLIFSFLVETAQYFQLVKLLGLEGSAFFATIIGTSFSHIDLICYAVGCVLFWIAEKTVIHFIQISKQSNLQNS